MLYDSFLLLFFFLSEERAAFALVAAFFEPLLAAPCLGGIVVDSYRVNPQNDDQLGFFSLYMRRIGLTYFDILRDRSHHTFGYTTKTGCSFSASYSCCCFFVASLIFLTLPSISYV